MQAIASYGWLYDEAIKNRIEPNSTNLYNLRKELSNNKIYLLEKVKIENSHGGYLASGQIEVTKESIASAIHNISIVPSKLYNIFNKDKENVISMHSYNITKESSLFKINSKADDGIIEGIESYDEKTWIIGVQWHPELNSSNPLWKAFINACNERK